MRFFEEHSRVKYGLILFMIVFAHIGVYVAAQMPHPFVDIASSYVDSEDGRFPLDRQYDEKFWIKVPPEKAGRYVINITLNVLNNGGPGDIKVGIKIIDAKNYKIINDLYEIIFVNRQGVGGVELTTTLPEGVFMFEAYAETVNWRSSR